MRILLVRPPGRRFPGQVEPTAGLPLGCLYIAAMLEAAEYEVSVLDCQLYADEHPSWKWGDREMFGFPWSEVEREIQRCSPDLVGISNQFTVQIDSAVEVAEIVKHIDPNIVTVLGGNHASALPRTFFDLTNSIDIVCMGEGERRLLDVICCFEGRKRFEDIKGITFRKDGMVVVNEQGPYLTTQDLNALPFPAYHLVNMERYFRLQKKGYLTRGHYEYPGSHRAVSMITSRGCPYNCTFCSIHLHMGKRFRVHSVNNVLEHIELLTSQYSVRHIYFEDDNLTLDRARFSRLLDGLLTKQFGITWDTPNGVRADLLPKELIAKSKEAGCTHLVLGVESGNQANLDRIVKKKLDLQHVERAARACKEVGLDLWAFFIIGFPQETIKDMQATLDYALRLEREYDVSPILNVLKPLIGTEVYHEALARGYLIEDVMPATMGASIAGRGLIETENFTRTDIARLAKGFYRKSKLLLAKKMARFILRHPQALVRLIGVLWRSPNRKQSLRIAMGHTNCLVRDFGSAPVTQLCRSAVLNP